MALVTIPGDGLWVPAQPIGLSGATPTFTSLTIDATGEKVAFCGRVFNKDRSSKTIDKVHFRFGTVTKSGGSAIRVSLQDPTTLTPMNPDGTADQYRDIANGDGSFISNVWYTTGLITSDGTDTGSKRTVGWNEEICVVVEFDPGGRLGSDSVNITGITQTVTVHSCISALYTGSWAAQTCMPNVLFEFSDGTYGTLQESWPCSSITTATHNSGTAGTDEYALAFQLPWPCKIDGCWFCVTVASASSDFEVGLLTGSGSYLSGFPISVPADNASNTSGRFWVMGLPETELSANTTYYLSIKPTSANNISITYIGISNGAYLQAHGGGSNFRLATALNGGAYSNVSNAKPFIGIRLSAFDDAAAVGPRVMQTMGRNIYGG